MSYLINMLLTTNYNTRVGANFLLYSLFALHKKLKLCKVYLTLSAAITKFTTNKVRYCSGKNILVSVT